MKKIEKKILELYEYLYWLFIYFKITQVIQIYLFVFLKYRTQPSFNK